MDSVKTLLQKDRIAEAVDAWLATVPQGNLERRLINLSARHANYLRLERSGTVSFENLTLERNRIREDLINLLQTESVTATEASPTALPAPRKIAFLEANPILDRNLQSNIEYREVRDLLAKYPDRFQFHSEFAITLERMIETIERYRPDVLHIVTFSSPEHLIIHDQADRELQIPYSELIAQFDLPSHRPEALFFNTWISEHLAAALSERGSFVIGSHSLITSLAAIEFATGFYTALGYGKDYYTAFQTGYSVVNRGVFKAEADKLFAYAKGKPVR